MRSSRMNNLVSISILLRNTVENSFMIENGTIYKYSLDVVVHVTWIFFIEMAI